MRAADTSILDAVIVGGGPAGLSAALLLARCCKRLAVIDGGRPRNAAARHLHGFLTRDGTPPHHLLRMAREELARYGVEVISDTVTSGRCLAPCAEQPYPTAFAIETKAGQLFTGRKLLIATGMCDTIPDLPGVRECYGVSVHHCPYCDGYEHRGKRLIAFGATAEEAIGLSLALRGWSDRITALSHGDPINEKNHERLAGTGIEALPHRIASLEHDDARLTAIRFEDGESIEADALFFNTPKRAACELAVALGCKFDENETVRTSAKQKSQVPGLFLAGDADGDVQFVIVAAAEGATAAVAMNRELQEENGSMLRKTADDARGKSRPPRHRGHPSRHA